MIKIQQSSYPVVWQIDNSYSLPSTTGQVRWNGATKCFEVCDNNNSSYNGGWMRIDNTVQLSSDPQLQTVLEWAKKKMAEEQNINQLVDKYPSLKAAKEHFDIVLKLVENDNTGNT
jgi:hypothetical protein